MLSHIEVLASRRSTLIGGGSRFASPDTGDRGLDDGIGAGSGRTASLAESKSSRSSGSISLESVRRAPRHRVPRQSRSIAQRHRRSIHALGSNLAQAATRHASHCGQLLFEFPPTPGGSAPCGVRDAVAKHVPVPPRQSGSGPTTLLQLGSIPSLPDSEKSNAHCHGGRCVVPGNSLQLTFSSKMLFLLFQWITHRREQQSLSTSVTCAVSLNGAHVSGTTVPERRCVPTPKAATECASKK